MMSEKMFEEVNGVLTVKEDECDNCPLFDEVSQAGEKLSQIVSQMELIKCFMNNAPDEIDMDSIQKVLKDSLSIIERNAVTAYTKVEKICREMSGAGDEFDTQEID